MVLKEIKIAERIGKVVMKEIEKRRGFSILESQQLKNKVNCKFPSCRHFKRTILVKVEGEDFSPDPGTLIDIKIKLLDLESVWSIKHGSWHGDTTREEYEIYFNRQDLSNIISALSLLSYKKFILLSTLRTSWQMGPLTYTLDEYTDISKALFEVEVSEPANEEDLNQAFSELEISPMDSDETIDFIRSINQHKDIQIDLNRISPKEVAARMLEIHSDVR